MLSKIHLAMRTVGATTCIKEFFRRFFGIDYCFKGIPVKSSRIFGLITRLIDSGFEVFSENQSIVVKSPYGYISVDFNDIELLDSLLEPFNEIFRDIDIVGKIVIDIGAYIGDTPLFFVSKNASKIYAYEPVDKHYKYLISNLKRNNVYNKVIPVKRGIWFYRGIVSVSYSGLTTGLYNSGFKVDIEVEELSDVLKTIFDREGRVDLVKMDCEGCEYVLINTPVEDIHKCREYIVEIHGSPYPIIDYMMRIGYSFKVLKLFKEMVGIYYFKYRD